MRAIILLSILYTLLSAEPREALLIGNHDYSYINNLDDPMKNLKRLKRTLEDVKFHVEIKEDLDSEHLEEAIDNFKNRLAKDSSTIGFLYYTGHGCQVEYQGYLIPTNVDTTKKLKIKYNALNINEMLEKLKGAGNKVNLLFLDACRDVPTGTKGGTKGLTQPTNTPKGSLVVYATEAGKVANDNAKFINSLIENINKPNQQIESLGSNISRVVAKKTNYTQIPVVYAKLLPENMVLKSGYIAPIIPSKPRVVKLKPVYVPPVVKPQTHSTKNIVTIDGLMYQNQPFTKEYTWKEAKEYCQDLTLGGYSDWRLPTRAELNKISNIKMYEKFDDNYDKWFDKNKHRRFKNSKGEYHFIDKRFIENMPKNSWFWTSEEKDSSSAWGVFFEVGSDGWDGKSSKGLALCVR